MKNFNKAILVAAVLGMSATAQAATDGTIGTTSTGTSDVMVVKENAVMITDVGDLDLGIMNSTAADLVAFDDVCVFNSTANYQITVTTSNTSFELSDGGTGAIPYALTWADDGGIPGSVVYGTTVTGLVGDRTSPSCGGGTNARFTVSVLAADFNSAAPGTYTDTLTLMVEPE